MGLGREKEPKEVKGFCPEEGEKNERSLLSKTVQICCRKSTD